MCAKGLHNALVEAGWTVELHKKMFPDEGEKPDHEWIPIVTEEGYVIITSDKRMKSWFAEEGKVRPAIEKCGAKIFFLRGMAPANQAAAINAAERAICRHVKKNAGTWFFARIHGSGLQLGQVDVQHVGGTSSTTRKYRLGST